MNAPSPKMLEVIESNTRPATLPSLPELRLRLITEGTPLWRATETELESKGIPTPYWAVAWAGGMGLARYVLDHPETVAGKRVLDFATGSGVVAIAAMKAGAARVRATEIDGYSIEAARLNAALNDVSLDLVLGDVIDDPCADIDVVLAGDVFFERELAQRSIRWFRELASRGVLVLIGDPGRYLLPKNNLTLLSRYDFPEPEGIEDEGVRRTSVFSVGGVSARPTRR